MSIESRLINLITKHNLRLKDIFEKEKHWIGSVIKLDKVFTREILDLIEPDRADYKSDMLREKQDYIEEVKLAGGKVD